MMIDALWQLRPFRVWIVTLFLMLVAQSAIMSFKINEANITALFVMVVAVLAQAFLSQLPTGSIKRRIFFELYCFLLASIIGIIGMAFCIVDQPAEDMRWASQFFIPLALASYGAVRFFGRLYSVWREMRNRRLVWQITHAQLRLVILTMLILFCGMIILFMGQIRDQPIESTVINGTALFIGLGGIFGIITGVLLVIVVIPAGVIAYLTAQRLTKRIEQLANLTHSIRGNDYSKRIVVEGEDEISSLQSDFNTMLSRIETSQQSLADERDRVRTLLQTRQRLFAEVSHELRTPITILRSYLDGLTVSDDQSNDLEVIQREIIRLQHLVDNVFAFARADVKTLNYHIQATEISGTLEHVTQTIHKQAWQSHKVSVVLEYQPQIPLVMVDAERVEQVLYNLLRNAIRHTSPGGLIRVDVSVTEKVVQVNVQDTGSGIAPDDLAHIWERFYRGNNTDKADQDGAGLGLALVKEMVETMGGEVGVESKLGEGSCFWFTLLRAQI